MKRCEKCNIAKLLNEFHRCAGRKDGRQGYCKVCVTAHRRAWARVHPESGRAMYLARKDTQKYKEWCKRSSSKYAAANRSKTRAATTKWRLSNLERRAAYSAQRRAEKVCAIPAWANKFFIDEAYSLARLRTVTTGYEWHVDHIVPLKSQFVCGLHVENNLRVIPGVYNTAKGNRHWPDMPTRSG